LQQKCRVLQIPGFASYNLPDYPERGMQEVSSQNPFQRLRMLVLQTLVQDLSAIGWQFLVEAVVDSVRWASKDQEEGGYSAYKIECTGIRLRQCRRWKSWEQE